MQFPDPQIQQPEVLVRYRIGSAEHEQRERRKKHGEN
jgi:hypothetical protein